MGDEHKDIKSTACFSLGKCPGKLSLESALCKETLGAEGVVFRWPSCIPKDMVTFFDNHLK